MHVDLDTLATALYRDHTIETWLNNAGITVIRPADRTETTRPGRGPLRAVRQTIASVNQTFKAQLDLEQHGGRITTGVTVRILQHVLASAMAAFDVLEREDRFGGSRWRRVGAISTMFDANPGKGDDRYSPCSIHTPRRASRWMVVGP